MITKFKTKLLIILSATLASLLILAGAFMLAPRREAHADEEETHDHSTMTAINSNGELTAGAYYLTDNISGNISVTGEVTLCLNGHTVTGDGNGSVITVSEGVEFTLCDCTGTGIITGVDGNTLNGGGVYVDINAVFEMNGGTISGNTAKTYRNGDRFEGGYGGGVYVSENSTLTMTGGTISGNSASYGGGVYVSENSTFTMNGGTISGNTKAMGGGVYVNGTFKMTGGTISENVAFDEDMFSRGGGVYVDINAVFEMYGGTISGNKAKAGGGGLYSWRGNLSVSGTPNITGNKLTDDTVSDDTVSNVDYFGSSNIITVTGELTAGAQIGFFKTGAVAEGFTQEGNPADFFIPDDSANNCVYVSEKTSGTVTVGEHSYGYDSDADGHWQACVNCGEANGEKEAHDGDPCTVCGETQDDEATHSFANGICTVCGEDFSTLYWGFNNATGTLTLSALQTDAAPNEYGTVTEGSSVYPAWRDVHTVINSVRVDRYAYAPASMRNWFSGRSGMTSVDLSLLDTSRVTDMVYLFNGCSGLEELDLSSFDTTNVTGYVVYVLRLQRLNFAYVFFFV